MSAESAAERHAAVARAIEAIRAGGMLILVDDEDRENEGDLICAASLVTPELITFMVKRAGGLICVALTGERVDQLGLAPMAESNPDEYRTAYTVSVDASPRFGVTTGISAQDRATTIHVAVDPVTTPVFCRLSITAYAARTARRLSPVGFQITPTRG